VSEEVFQTFRTRPHYTNQNDGFNITTNISELIAKALRRTAETYAQQALSDIEQALRQKIDQYIDGRFVSKDEVDNLLKIARCDKIAMDQMSGALNNKRTEFEQRIKDEASRQTEQALQNVIQGNTPSI
jgi:hypothetical protein